MRRSLIALLAVVVLAVMAGAVWRYVRAEGPVPELLVSEIEGEVTLVRSGGGEAGGDRATAASAGGAPVAATEGMVLGKSDRLATGDGARAELLLGDDTHIKVGPTSSLQVLSVDEAGVSLELENGALEATVRPESGAVRVGNRGRAVLSTNGAFQVGVRDEVLQVVASSGDIALSGMDQTRLRPGEQATVLDRHAEIGDVPEELLLAVDWPAEARTRAETGQVVGRTSPGATVVVRGTLGEQRVIADREGRFEAMIALAEGENRVVVEAIDVLGRKSDVPGVLVRDTRGPAFQGGVRYERGGDR